MARFLHLEVADDEADIADIREMKQGGKRVDAQKREEQPVSPAFRQSAKPAVHERVEDPDDQRCGDGVDGGVLP